MARTKNSNGSSDNNARIKLVFFEAENVNSDLTGVINAFANAIRNAPVQVITHQNPPALIDSDKTTPTNKSQSVSSLTDNEDNVVEGALAPHALEKQARNRKPFKGTILDDINWDGGGTSFVEYVKQKNPQSTAKKYLVIVSWFKRYGGYEAVSANLMYNAYRKMGWTALTDITQPLRHGASAGRGHYRNAGKGNYVITNIGLDVADTTGSDNSNEF